MCFTYCASARILLLARLLLRTRKRLTGGGHLPRTFALRGCYLALRVSHCLLRFADALCTFALRGGDTSSSVSSLSRSVAYGALPLYASLIYAALRFPKLALSIAYCLLALYAGFGYGALRVVQLTLGVGYCLTPGAASVLYRGASFTQGIASVADIFAVLLPNLLHCFGGVSHGTRGFTVSACGLTLRYRNLPNGDNSGALCVV